MHRIAAKLVPQAVAARRKVPFSAPIQYWLAPLARTYLAEPELVRDGVLSRAGVEKWTTFQEGRSNYPYKLWSLVMLEIWYRLFVTRSLVPERFPLPPPVRLREESGRSRVAA